MNVTEYPVFYESVGSAKVACGNVNRRYRANINDMMGAGRNSETALPYITAVRVCCPDNPGADACLIKEDGKWKDVVPPAAEY